MQFASGEAIQEVMNMSHSNSRAGHITCWTVTWLLLLGAGSDIAAGNGHQTRSLVDEASRAEVRERGLFINMGSPDQHKYIRGGWRTGWGVTRSEKNLAAIVSKTAWLHFWDWKGGARSMVMRIRSPHRGQRLSVKINGLAAGGQKIPGDWSVVEFPFSRSLSPGRNDISLHFAKETKGKPAAQVDWIWFKAEDGPPPSPAKEISPVFVEARPSLKADPPRSYSYYLEIPPEAWLSFSYAAVSTSTFSVDVTLDGQKSRRLFTSPAKKNEWSVARVDLSEFSGRVVRLDLVSGGPAGSAAWGQPSIRVPGPAPRVPKVTPANRAKNLIYIVIDTARQDAYRAFKSETRVQTPFFDAFVADSMIFPNAYTNAPWTKPSAATYLSGLYPATHGAQRKKTVLSRKVPLIQEHLQKQGFLTAGFIANGYLSKKFGFRRGWDTYRNYIRQGMRSDAQYVYQDALKWLATLKDQRFFLFIQSIDPHVPYQAPSKFMKPYCDPKYRGRFKRFFDGYATEKFLKGELKLTEKEKKRIVCLYDAEVSYHDEYFGRFLSSLQKRGLLENTLVVVSSDHGEELFEHGKLDHGHDLWEELMRTPLAIRYPRLFPASKKSDAVVGLVDFVPTVLQVLDVEAMPNLEGASLLDAAYGKPVPPPGYAILERRDQQRAVRVGRLKLIESLNGRTRLFDLATDPGEKKNLARSRPLARRACEVYLGEGLEVRAKKNRLSSMGRKRDLTGPETTIGDELREQLKSLGYVE
jgi:choline-sulfatase